MAFLTRIAPPAPRRLILLAVVGLVAGVLSRMTHSPLAAAPAPADDGGPLAPSSLLKWQGVASCASTACHGGNEAREVKGSEYTTWVTYDAKHARAYQVLFADRSRRMIANLRDPLPADRNPLCLKCHVHDGAADSVGSVRCLLADGVSCEACHGRAEKWLTTHYLPAWKTLTQKEKIEWGMRPTKDLLQRAKACVECHVGSGDKEVNHDLIAAGHPRLNFEYGAFLAIMPKHWSEREEKERYPDFEARAWALGQVVSAQAALELLAHRAKTATKPWPEFAEYDCFACHHDLQAKSWRQQREYQGRKPGALTWGTWYTPMLPRALGGLSGKANPALLSRLDELTNQMQTPHPDRNNVAAEANALVRKLQGAPGTLEHKSDASTLRKLFDAIDKEDQRKADADWDGESQYYLALFALNEAIGDLDREADDPRRRNVLRTKLRELGFPKGYDSPKKFKPDPSKKRSP